MIATTGATARGFSEIAERVRHGQGPEIRRRERCNASFTGIGPGHWLSFQRRSRADD